MRRITNEDLRAAHEQAQRADHANRLQMGQDRLEREFRAQAPEVASRGPWAALGA